MNRQEAMMFNFLMALVLLNQTKKALKNGKTEKAKKLIELGKMYSLLIVAG